MAEYTAGKPLGGGAGGGATTLVQLTDFEVTYASSAYNVVHVNATADGLADTSIYTLLGTGAPAENANYIVHVNAGATAWEYIANNTGLLSDFPTYVGQDSKTLRAKSDASGMEWVTASFLNLSDTFASYAGLGGQTLRVNAGATAVEAYTPTALTLANAYTGGNTITTSAGTPVQLIFGGLAATTDTTLQMVNTTAASGGATVQVSPADQWTGYAWTGAASHAVDMRAYCKPRTAATVDGSWCLDTRVNAGAWSNLFEANFYSSSTATNWNRSNIQLMINGVLAVGTNPNTYMALNNAGSAAYLGLSSSTYQIYCGASSNQEAIWINAGKTDASGMAFALVMANTTWSTPPATATHTSWRYYSGSNATQEFARLMCNGDLIINKRSNGQDLGIKTLTEVLTIDADSTSNTAIQFPAGCLALGADCLVTTTIPTATSLDIGLAAHHDPGNDDCFGVAVGVSAGSSNGTSAMIVPRHLTAATPVYVNINGTDPANNNGRLRVTIYYMLVTNATT